MKHKVKLVGVQGDIIHLKVDGASCSYLIQRPLPLSFADPNMLRSVMDTRLLESLFQSSGMMRPRRRLLQWFSGLWRRKVEFTSLPHTSTMQSLFPRSINGERIADYIEKVGIKLDIDEEVKGVVLLESDVERIRGGNLQQE